MNVLLWKLRAGPVPSFPGVTWMPPGSGQPCCSHRASIWNIGLLSRRLLGSVDSLVMSGSFHYTFMVCWSDLPRWTGLCPPFYQRPFLSSCIRLDAFCMQRKNTWALLHSSRVRSNENGSRVVWLAAGCSCRPGSPAHTGGWEGIWGSLLLSSPLLLCWRAAHAQGGLASRGAKGSLGQAHQCGKMQPCFSKVLCVQTENRRNINNHELLSV